MATQQKQEPILGRPANNRTADRMRSSLRSTNRPAGVAEAAKPAGVSRMLHYRRLQSDPVYRGAFERVQDDLADTLEGEAIRRARDGVKRPILYKGAPVKQGRRILYLTEYSDQLLIILVRSQNSSTTRIKGLPAKFLTVKGAENLVFGGCRARP